MQKKITFRSTHRVLWCKGVLSNFWHGIGVGLIDIGKGRYQGLYIASLYGEQRIHNTYSRLVSRSV